MGMELGRQIHYWFWGSQNRDARGVRLYRYCAGVTGKVTIRQGNKEGLTIEADDNFLPLIEIVVERGSLKIRPIERNTNFKGKGATLNIIVDVINVDHLSISGSGDMVADTLKSGKLKVAVAGSGDMRLNVLTVDQLKVSIAGSGDFASAGNANEVDISIAGSGEIKADRLKTKAAKLSIAGSGDVALWVTDTLKVSIAGSGDVRYFGDAVLAKSVAGSGNIQRLGSAPN